jgi:tetratricopeptide (TPR) repeat protein
MTQTQKSRREVLEQFVAQKPADALARYGLALECAKLGDDPAATAHFQKLLETNPQYVAGYFQFGQLLSRLGRLDEARKLLSDGIVVAQNAGDSHARDEMQAALCSLRP